MGSERQLLRLHGTKIRDRDPTRIEIAIRVAFTRALNENGSRSRSTRTCVLCILTEPRNTRKTIVLVFTTHP